LRRRPVGRTFAGVEDEAVDVVDLDDSVIRVARRSEVRARNLLHRGVSVLCLDSAGRVFVHRRSPRKDAFPGFFDMFVSGVVRSGESYDVAAGRELYEELGIRGAPRPLFKHLYSGSRKRCWIWVYELVWDEPVSPDPAEISWGAFLTPQALRERMDLCKFTPDNKSVFERYLGIGSGALAQPRPR
jgi:isopentenyldiphosphate isomerase